MAVKMKNSELKAVLKLLGAGENELKNKTDKEIQSMLKDILKNHKQPTIEDVSLEVVKLQMMMGMTFSLFSRIASNMPPALIHILNEGLEDYIKLYSLENSDQVLGFMQGNRKNYPLLLREMVKKEESDKESKETEIH